MLMCRDTAQQTDSVLYWVVLPQPGYYGEHGKTACTKYATAAIMDYGSFLAGSARQIYR